MFVRSIAASALVLGSTGAAVAQMVPPPPVGGQKLIDEVVVTASRRQQASSDVSAAVEVVSAEEIARTPAAYLTDVIKKNASVDVIQYPGGLAGIGLRGFRPEFSGTNQRVLLLVDGRPAGVTSLGNLSQAGVERVEVLKGAASALYGASAMGGVVNFLTRRSTGPLSGAADFGGGAFGTLFGSARVGGALGTRADFDIAVQGREQRDDFRIGADARQIGTFRQGGGVDRANTGFERYSYSARIGGDLGGGWRLEARGHGFDGLNETPGAESDLTNNQGIADIETLGGDVSLRGSIGSHELLALVHRTREQALSLDLPVNDPTSFGSPRKTTWRGAQLRDAWALSEALTLTLGVDYEKVENEVSRFNRATGAPLGPFSPNDIRETYGVYAEATARLLEERLIVTVGGRQDEIENTIQATPLRPDVVPGSSSFSTFNPRVGVVARPFASRAIRLHANAGSAFVSPLANQVAGFTDAIVGVQRRIARGNPGLEPESAESYDLGIGYESDTVGAALTVFRTDVRDRIESIITTNTTRLRESTFVNASRSRAEGLEAQLQGDVGLLFGAERGAWIVTSSATWFAEREQLLPAGPAPLRNVARFKMNAALSHETARYGFRVNGRFVSGMIDQDFSLQRVFTDGRGGLFQYPDFFVLDADLHYRVTNALELGLQVENLLDDYYYEKNDYPFTGRAYYIALRYRFD